MKNKIYIEIKTNLILIALLKEQKNEYKLFSIEKTLLNCLEFNEKKLFNLSKVFEIIKNYLIQHKIKKSSSIILIDKALTEDEINFESVLFQIILSISKTGLKIEKIINNSILRKNKETENKSFRKNDLMFINKKELNNKLDFFDKFKLPKQKSPKKWLTITTVLLISQIYFLNKSFKTKNMKLKDIKEKVHKLSVKLEPLKDEISKTNKIRINNLLIKNKIQKYNSNINSNNGYYTMLTNISEQIPNNCRLTKLTAEKDIKKNKKKTIVTLYGESLEQKSIQKFVQNLQKLTNITKSKIKKIKIDNEKLKYNFSIKSQMTNS